MNFEPKVSINRKAMQARVISRRSCAALADVLGNGLTQERVRRLLMHSSSSAMDALPDDWAAGLPQQAGLFSVDQWRRALQSARGQRSDPDAAERTLIPMLELLATGLANAEQAGKPFSAARQSAPRPARLSLKKRGPCVESVGRRNPQVTAAVSPPFWRVGRFLSTRNP
jgi:hypothetical protein